MVLYASGNGRRAAAAHLELLPVDITWAWSPDGRRLAIATMPGHFQCGIPQSAELWELPGSTDDGLFMPGWSPDGERLAVTGAPGYYAWCWDAENGQVLTRIDSDRPGLVVPAQQSWAPAGRSLRRRYVII